MYWAILVCVMMGSSWFITLDRSFYECLWEVQSGKRKVGKEKKKECNRAAWSKHWKHYLQSKAEFWYEGSHHLSGPSSKSKVPPVSVKLVFICVIVLLQSWTRNAMLFLSKYTQKHWVFCNCKMQILKAWRKKDDNASSSFQIYISFNSVILMS